MTTRTLLRAVSCAAVVILLLALGTPNTAAAQAADPEMVELIDRAVSNPSTRDRLTVEQWQRFSHQLTHALATDHDGLQQGALRMIIHYGDYLEFKRAATFDVVRIYRSHPNSAMRRMAVVALGQMRDAWGIDFLQRSVKFEKDPKVHQTLISVLNEHAREKLGPAKIGG